MDIPACSHDVLCNGFSQPIETIRTDQFVTCPCCGEPMRLVRTVPQLGELPEMQRFECRLCRLAVTAEEVLGIVEMASWENSLRKKKPPNGSWLILA